MNFAEKVRNMRPNSFWLLYAEKLSADTINGAEAFYIIRFRNVNDLFGAQPRIKNAFIRLYGPCFAQVFKKIVFRESLPQATRAYK